MPYACSEHRGFLGLMLTAIFANRLGSKGFLNENITSNSAQLMEKLIGALAILVWYAIVSFILLKYIEKVIGLCVSEDSKTEGLDLVLHDESGYNL